MKPLIRNLYILSLICGLFRRLSHRVAEPDYKMERDLDDGKLQGTMYGVIEAPAGHKHKHKPKHKHRSHTHQLGKLMKSVVAASRGVLVRA